MILLVGKNKVIRVFPHFIHKKGTFDHGRKLQVVPVSIRVDEGKPILCAQGEKPEEIFIPPIALLLRAEILLHKAYTHQISGMPHHMLDLAKTGDTVFSKLRLMRAQCAEMPQIPLRILPQHIAGHILRLGLVGGDQPNPHIGFHLLRQHFPDLSRFMAAVVKDGKPWVFGVDRPFYRFSPMVRVNHKLQNFRPAIL